MFLQWFPSKHGTLHFCRHKTGRKHHVRQCFQFPYLPNRWKYRYLQCFLQFFHVPMPVANSNIYIRNPSKTLFLTVFSNVSSQTDGHLHVFCHKGSKSFQNIAFDSVFVMFPVKHTVIYTFFAITSVQKHLFLQCFQCPGIQKPCKFLLCTMFFFHFWPFFHCRKATKMTPNSISIPSCAQTPKNPRKMSKTPPYSGLGAKPFLGPPPQLKLI